MKNTTKNVVFGAGSLARERNFMYLDKLNLSAHPPSPVCSSIPTRKAVDSWLSSIRADHGPDAVSGLLGGDAAAAFDTGLGRHHLQEMAMHLGLA